MQIVMNGEVRTLPNLAPGATLAELIAALELKGDRIAVEHNGSIVSRKEWPSTAIADNDKLEVVHFVGGGTATPPGNPDGRVLGSFLVALILVLAASSGAAARGAEQRTATQSAEPQAAANQAAPAIGAPATAASIEKPQPESDISGKPTFIVPEIKPGVDLKIVAYGDSRFTDPRNVVDAVPRPRKWLVDRIAAEAPDAVFFSGDMPFHGDDPADWALYQRETEPWRAAHLRVYPTIGNHEVTFDARLGIANYFANFPYLEQHRWYSVQIGNVYLVAFDSLWPPSPGTPERSWLAAQLASLPPAVDFVFFLSHMPLVTDLQTQMAISLPTPDQIELRNFIEAESRKAHAKFVVINGHIHNYERYERNGVSYIVTGGGGAKPYPVMVRAEDDLYRQPGFPNFHYLVFHIHGKHATVTMNRLADPTAEIYKSEVRETFTLDAK